MKMKRVNNLFADKMILSKGDYDMDSNDTSVRAVERALAILNCFSESKFELSLTEIAREIGLAPSTTTRLISSLEKNNFLARNIENQKYYLGSKLAQLGNLCFSHMNFRKVAQPYMVELRDLFNESVSLYVVEGNYRVCIERVESTQSLRKVINIGRRLPLTRGASGKLLLSYLPKDKIRNILMDDPYVTEAQLEEIKQIGYAISFAEREEGVTSIAAPVFNAEKKMITALTMSGPSVRFHDEEITQMVKKVVEYANKISFALGY